AEPFVLAEQGNGTRAGVITGSLRASLARADLPADVAAQVTRMLAGRIDSTQRGAQLGMGRRVGGQRRALQGLVHTVVKADALSGRESR
ncbi:hypothetical protein SB861_62705, partial [Paraburkholderia sp. SIMBA_049]